MKQDYIKQTNKVTLIIGGAIALVLGLFQVNFGLGLLLGLLVGVINLWITNNYIDGLFLKGKFTVFSFILYVVVNYGLMVLAFLLSVLFPTWVNIYMVALGLFMLKLVMYGKELVFYKKRR